MYKNLFLKKKKKEKRCGQFIAQALQKVQQLLQYFIITSLFSEDKDTTDCINDTTIKGATNFRALVYILKIRCLFIVILSRLIVFKTAC